MKRRLHEDEKALWRAVTHDVRPRSPTTDQPLEQPVAVSAPTPVVQALTFRQSSKAVATLSAPLPMRLDPLLEKRIRSGRARIEARLDLHGMTEAEAHESLCAFVQSCSGMNLKLGLIITGRGRSGGGVLKRNVPRWLEAPALRPMIKSVHTASDRHGGDGARYVLFVQRSRSRSLLRH